MNRRGPWRTTLRGVALAVPVLATALLGAAPGALAAGRADSPHHRAARSAPITIEVRSVTPSSPLISTTKRPLRIVLELTNLTGRAIDHVVITGTRGDPIGNRTALTSALGADPAKTGYPIGTKHPVTIDLPPTRTTQNVSFDTNTGIPNDSGICLCHNAVYPLSFTATTTASDGTTTDLGTAGTYLPAFDKAPTKLKVSWVWPLIDRPHRLADDRVFTDDDLASSVSSDGRLDRSLSVLEKVAGSVPVTIVLDPELIDELEVMSTSRYLVQSGQRRVVGHGSAVARAWLARLSALLGEHPEITVQSTPFADAAVQSLANSGLSWRTVLPTAMSQRVNTALGGRAVDDDLSWPAGGAISSNTFGELANQGIRQLILDDESVAPRDGNNGAVPTGIARLSRHGYRIGAALLDPTVQRYVSSVVTRDGAGLKQLPQLIAQIAVRAAQNPSASHDLVLTPPRYADVDPDVAARAVLDSSSSPYATPTKLSDLLASGSLPHRLSHIAQLPSGTPVLPGHTLDAAEQITSQLPVVDSLLGLRSGHRPSAAALSVIDTLPVALQRCESSLWLYRRGAAGAYADALSDRVGTLTNGVQIVPPYNGAYTLASGNSPLPVTVANKLDYAVTIRLEVSTVNGLPGLTTRDIGTQAIAAHEQRTLKLPTSIVRSGRIAIEAELRVPSGQSIGSSVRLSVHSSAFGVVGVVITVVAGGVLVLALLVRALRWLLRRRAGGPAGSTDPTDPTGPTEPGDPDGPSDPPGRHAQREGTGPPEATSRVPATTGPGTPDLPGAGPAG